MLSDEQIEEWARRAHEAYRAGFHGQTSSSLAATPWEELSPERREDNRQQVMDVERKLALIGWAVVPADEPGAMPLDLDSEQRELLAEAEHERWVRRKLETGWTYGAERDDANKVHDLLVDYHELTDAQKDLDRQPVLALPEILRSCGLAVRAA